MIYNVNNLYINKFSPETGASQTTKLEECAFYQCLVALGESGIADKELFEFPTPLNGTVYARDGFSPLVTWTRNGFDLIHGKEHVEPLKIFLDYICLLYTYVDRSERVRELSYKQFLRLYQDIRDNGYDYELKPEICIKPNKGRFIIGDGQHRASILLYLAKAKGEFIKI